MDKKPSYRLEDIVLPNDRENIKESPRISKIITFDPVFCQNLNCVSSPQICYIETCKSYLKCEYAYKNQEK